MSTFSDVKGSASGSSISRLAPAFQSLHFSCIIPPTTQSQVQSFALSGQSFARNKPSPIPRGSSLPKSPPLAAHPANSPGTWPIERILSFCLFCLICQPSLGTGGGIGWRGKFELREGEEDNLGGEVCFYFRRPVCQRTCSWKSGEDPVVATVFFIVGGW